MRSRFEQPLSLSTGFSIGFGHGLEFNLKFRLAVRAGDDLALFEFVFRKFDLAGAIWAFGQQSQERKFGRIERFDLEFGPAVLADQDITNVKGDPFLGRHLEFGGAHRTGDQQGLLRLCLLRLGLIGLRLRHGESPCLIAYSPGNF